MSATRRGVLGLGAAVPLAAMVPVGTTHPDAALLAACAKVCALQDRIDAVWADPALAGHPDREALIDAAKAPIEEAQEEYLERVCALRAITLAGLRARARALAAWDKDFPGADDSCWNDRMVGGLLRDLGAEEAA